MTEGTLSGRHALVTGAGSGIGAAIAAALVRAGARVSLAGRRAEPLRSVAAALPEGATQVLEGFDVTDADAVARGLARARVAASVRSLCSSTMPARRRARRSARPTLAMWAHVLSVDLTERLSRDAGGARRHRVAWRPSAASSMSPRPPGLTGYAYVSAYCAAKHGVVGLTRALALEFARRPA